MSDVKSARVETTPDPRTSTPGLSDEDLLRHAVRVARPTRGRGKQPRWVGVMDTFTLGSTYSYALCRRFGYDPDEMVKPR